MKNRWITGLDTGATAVRAVVAQISDAGSLHIVGYSEVPCQGIRKGSVVDVAETVHAIESAVYEASEAAGTPIESVVLGVGGPTVASLNSSATVRILDPVRGVTKGEVAASHRAAQNIICPPDRQAIHAIPRRYTVDGSESLRNPLGWTGSRLTVQSHIVHASTPQLNMLIRCVTEAHLDVCDVVLKGLAASQVVLLHEEKESGVCLLDIGGNTTELTVFKDGTLYCISTIPVGGNHLTSDICYGLTVGKAEAERLKVSYGAAQVLAQDADTILSVSQMGRTAARKLRRRALIQIMEPRVRELFQLVCNELADLEVFDQLPAGIVLTGGTSLVADISTVAEETMGISVRTGCSTAAADLSSELTHPSFVVARGLVEYVAGADQGGDSIRSQEGNDESLRTLVSQFVRKVAKGIRHES